MTLDSEGNYYLVGSHSGKSDEERAASSVVVRFRLRGGDPPAIDDASVVRWNIARPLEAALQVQGVDAARVAEREVGGLAVREAGGRRELVIGLKKPDDKVRAFAADITDAPSPEATLSLRRAFAFDADRREGIAPQLTSLEYVPAMGGFLVLTAMVGDRQRGPRQHPLARQQRPAECGALVCDDRGRDEGRGPGRARRQGVRPPNRDQAPDRLRQRPARDQTSQPVPDGLARPPSGLSEAVTGLAPHLGRPPETRSSRSRSRLRTGCSPASAERSFSSRGSVDSS